MSCSRCGCHRMIYWHIAADHSGRVIFTANKQRLTLYVTVERNVCLACKEATREALADALGEPCAPEPTQ